MRGCPARSERGVGACASVLLYVHINYFSLCATVVVVRRVIGDPPRKCGIRARA